MNMAKKNRKLVENFGRCLSVLGLKHMGYAGVEAVEHHNRSR
jgi:hypothetical protein